MPTEYSEINDALFVMPRHEALRIIAAELEEWVASHSKDGSTQGYNERSSRDAFKRIRRAFAALD